MILTKIEVLHIHVIYSAKKYKSIWLKMMRMHIDLNICHFLLLSVSIAEAWKSKIKGKTGIHSPSPCWGSTTEPFLFHRVFQKMAKNEIFWTLLWQLAIYLLKIRGHKRRHFWQFWGVPYKTKIVLKYSPNIGMDHGCQFPPYFWIFWPQKYSQSIENVTNF